MSNKHALKPVAAAIGTTFAVALSASPLAGAAGNPFELTEYANGCLMAEHHEGTCGGSKAAGEGTCGEKTKGEGSCGSKAGGEGACGEKMKGEGTCGADKSEAEGKCGEGKCGSAA